MTKRRKGRKVKAESGWNRRIKVERTERSAEAAERNDWSKTASRLRARGGLTAGPNPDRGWTAEGTEPTGAAD